MTDNFKRLPAHIHNTAYTPYATAARAFDCPLKSSNYKRRTQLANIKEWTKISYNDCIRVAQDRERWRSMTADLLTTDGT